MISDRIATAGLLPPRTLTLSITNGCNLRCAHCWPDSGAEGLAAPVPTETVCRIASEFVELGGKTLILTGGEPLTHPKWASILDFCCRSAGLREVVLQTNATLIRPDIAKYLAAPELAILRIQPSLDGATPQAHEHFRGPGTFQRAMDGICLMCEAGLGPRIQVAFTETRRNFHELPDLLAMLDHKGVGRLIAGTIVKNGRAAGHDNLRLPTPNQCRDLITMYETDAAFQDRYNRMASISSIEWHKQKKTDPPVAPTCHCIETPYIDAAGRLFPCGLFQNPAYAAPGVHNRPLWELMDQGLKRWSQLLDLSRQRLDKILDCRDCFCRDQCGSGCMGRAFAAHGILMAPEDRCHLRRAVYNFGNQTD